MDSNKNIIELSKVIQGEGKYIGNLSLLIRFKNCNLRCGWCFGLKSGRRIPDVIMSDKQNKHLNNVKIGDKLLTLDENHNLVETTVKNISIRESPSWYEMKINDTEYYVTSEHPFFTTKGLVEAKDLQVGDMIYHITSHDKLSFKMKNNNPMKDNEISMRKASHTDYNEVGRKTSITRKKLISEGKILPSIIGVEGKKRISELMKNNNPMFDPDTRKKVSNTLKEIYASGNIKYGIMNPEIMKKNKEATRIRALTNNPMKNPDVVKKNFLSHQKPKSKYEERFELLCKKYGIKVEFTGDGRKEIGYKYPDFIIPETNKVIEIYSSTFKYDGNKREEEWFEKRKNHFEKFGFDVLFIDMDERDENITIKKVNEFLQGIPQSLTHKYVDAINWEEFDNMFEHNGYEVQSKKWVNRNGMFWSKDQVPKPMKFYNLTCEPYNTYLIDYMWVHNCDTKYSLTESGKYNLSDVFNFIRENKSKFHHVIITGGEPLLYQEDIRHILKNFPSMLFTIETNGTIKPEALLSNLMSQHLWSVSPKLYLWDDTPLLKQIIGWDTFSNVQFKFVITCPEDLNKIKFLIDTQIIEKQIIIQPDGNRLDYNNACRELAEGVILNELSQVRVLPQFHKICWGNKRGV